MGVAPFDDPSWSHSDHPTESSPRRPRNPGRCRHLPRQWCRRALSPGIVGLTSSCETSAPRPPLRTRFAPRPPDRVTCRWRVATVDVGQRCPHEHAGRPDSQARQGPLAQLAEHRTFNPRVVGSSPTGPTVSSTPGRTGTSVHSRVHRLRLQVRPEPSVPARHPSPRPGSSSARRGCSWDHVTCEDRRHLEGQAPP